MNKVKEFVVTCDFIVEAESEENAYEKLLDYLAECVQYGDVTAFEFKEAANGWNRPKLRQLGYGNSGEEV
jgi:hypothetical protein